MTLTINLVLKSGLSVAGPRARLGASHAPGAPILTRVWVFQSPGPSSLLWNPSLGGTPAAEYRTPPVPHNDLKLLEARLNPQRGRLIHGPGDHPAIPQPSLTQNPDRSLQKGRTLALHSNPEKPPSRSVDGACHTLGPKPKPSLCFQTSGPAALTHTLNAGAPGATAQDCACPLQGNSAHSTGHKPTD